MQEHDHAAGSAFQPLQEALGHLHLSSMVATMMTPQRTGARVSEGYPDSSASREALQLTVRASDQGSTPVQNTAATIYMADLYALQPQEAVRKVKELFHVVQASEVCVRTSPLSSQRRVLPRPFSKGHAQYSVLYASCFDSCKHVQIDMSGPVIFGFAEGHSSKTAPVVHATHLSEAHILPLQAFHQSG